LSADIRFVDVTPLPVEAPVAVEGLPDVGLVGALAALHLADTLEMVEVAHVETSLLPPVMVLHRGVLQEPMRILGTPKAPLLVFTSEVAVHPALVYELARTATDWFASKGVRGLVSLGGIPTPNRMDIEEPAVVGVPNGEAAMASLRQAGVEVMQEGFIAGAYALLLKEFGKRRLPGWALLAQAHLNYPDPGAAAAALRVLSGMLGLSIDVTPLLERADELRVKGRDLMRQAQASMGSLGKTTEQEIPLMYR